MSTAEASATRAQAGAHKGWVARLGDSLRERVAQLLGGSLADLASLPAGDIRALLHELDLHQVELELRNEELRKTQRHLAESRDRLSDLYEFAPVAYLTLDTAAVVCQCNLAAAELLGLSRKKLIGKSFTAFLAPPSAEAFHGYFRDTALVSTLKTSCDLAMHKSDHSLLQVRMECTAMSPAAAEPGRCHAALIDVTHTARDQAQLRELNRSLEQAVTERTAALTESLERLQVNEERLRLALDAGGMGTWSIDLGSKRAFCDERHEALFAREPEPSGHVLEEWITAIHPGDRRRMVAVMERAVSGEDAALAAEYRIVWPDRSVHWLMVRGRVQYDEQGRPVRIVGVEQDIDERKALEMEVLSIAEVEQRRIGQELHDDIQQRLTGVGLMAENLCDALGRKSAPESRLCERLTAEIGEASTRVRRLSHGLVPLELEGGGLGVALHRLAHASHVPGRLSCVFKSDPALEVHDGVAATHLYRIAQEAVSNAIRHSGCTSIRIRLSHQAGRTLMTVADNGCGMPPGRGEGRGIRIMAYRASLIGATLKVAPGRPAGTRVSCAFADVEPEHAGPANDAPHSEATL